MGGELICCTPEQFKGSSMKFGRGGRRLTGREVYRFDVERQEICVEVKPVFDIFGRFISSSQSKVVAWYE